MRCKTIALLILATLAFAPGRVLAQTKIYSCPQTIPGGACIDSITVIPATSAGGVSLDVHWLWQLPHNFPHPADFFQLRYALPGGQDTQVKFPGGLEGVFNLPLGPTAGGEYTFKIQGCENGGQLGSAACWGGNQQPWDVEVFTYTPATSTTSSGLTAAPVKPSCAAGLQHVGTPCPCAGGSGPSCDPVGTETCLSAAQLKSVPNCSGATSLVCGNLPPIASRDPAGNWFNKVTMSCAQAAVQTSPDGTGGSKDIKSNKAPPSH
jgi:hypothetical protein